jgi:RHS repeat-associated protein
VWRGEGWATRHGTITSLIDSSGNAVASYTYDAYGNPTATAGSVVNPFRYTGREFDSDTGLYYYRARYYGPTAGRFLSEDPVRFKGGPNFYSYVSNSPVVRRDPSGLFPTKLHYDMTYQLALATFGNADQAKEVANADAAVDALPTIADRLEFILFMGDGWKNGGPHFPTQDLMYRLSQNALNTCSLVDLGIALHSIQDHWAHSPATPLLHYLTGEAIDILAAQDAATIDSAMNATADLLKEFKDHCSCNNK